MNRLLLTLDHCHSNTHSFTLASGGLYCQQEAWTSTVPLQAGLPLVDLILPRGLHTQWPHSLHNRPLLLQEAQRTALETHGAVGHGGGPPTTRGGRTLALDDEVRSHGRNPVDGLHTSHIKAQTDGSNASVCHPVLQSGQFFDVSLLNGYPDNSNTHNAFGLVEDGRTHAILPQSVHAGVSMVPKGVPWTTGIVAFFFPDTQHHDRSAWNRYKSSSMNTQSARVPAGSWCSHSSIAT